jgi:MinD-like ATPase involved in chromosome partitioning or flagellar assembly
VIPGERFVVLGLAPPRAAWFRSVGVWATSGALPAEFLKCVSAEEVRARLGSGRPFSALVVDAGLPSVDRDLLAAAAAVDCAVLVVDDGRATRDWLALGAARVLAPSFGRDDLVTALAACARTIRRGDAPAAELSPRPARSFWRGTVAAVTGPGGTGVSTVAMALAQALGDEEKPPGPVLLADLRLNAELAMLHDVRDVAPGVQELVESHRSGQPTAEAVRALAWAVDERRYDLLLGLRRPRFWPALRPQAFEAAFDTLCRAYRVVVCDVDPDLEGEDGGGSIDVEERNVMARTATSRADVVFAVGSPSLKGVHALVRVVTDLMAFGVPAHRIVPVLNRSPRSPRARAALGTAVAELAVAANGARLAGPVHLPERDIESDLHDGHRLPAVLGAPLAGALHAVLGRVAERPLEGVASPDGQRVTPGSLGAWAGDEAAI